MSRISFASVLVSSLLTASVLPPALGTLGCLAGCSKKAEQPPEAPPMPPGWAVRKDTVLENEQLWELQGRLEGRPKAARTVLYEVQSLPGQKIQLNIIVPADSAEGDKMYRILANKKPAWAFVRKAEVLYEFVGPSQAAEEIQKARALLGP